MAQRLVSFSRYTTMKFHSCSRKSALLLGLATSLPQCAPFPVRHPPAVPTRTSMVRRFASVASGDTNPPHGPNYKKKDDKDNEFQPNPPPGTHGTPVFDDIDFDLLERDTVELESHRRNTDPNAVFVVTGASRGMGLAFVQALLQQTQGTVVACCRSPHTAEQMHSLAVDHKHRLDIVALDLQDQASVEAAGRILRDRYTRVDALFNVAGLLGDGQTTPGPERTIQKLDRTWMEQTMAVNVLGPVLFCKELSPLLMHRKQRRPSKSTNPTDTNNNDTDTDIDTRPTAVVVNVSARVGSIADNNLGGWYSYRMSKAALNQATRTMALEFQRHDVWAVAVHPGTTDTDLSRPFSGNVKAGSLFPVHFTVHKLLTLVNALQDKHSGGFYDWAGQALSF